MLVYNKTKADFLTDVSDSRIEDIVIDCIKQKLQMNVNKSSMDSFRNSLQEMYFVLNDTDIPGDSWIAIEYRIPQTSKRIDIIVTGQDESMNEHAIIIELKQWETAKLTEKDWVVITRFKAGEAETSHPSYQAWSYAALLQWFNETIYNENVQLNPCAYLHNYKEDGIINNQFYGGYIQKAPLFLKSDKEKLRDFIKKFVKYWDKKNLMFRIENWRIRPSKHLADNMASMLKWNQEFVMIDDQKVVYENAMALAKNSSAGNKNVLIVEGWPGTWKSVVAINLLVGLTKAWLLTKYVTKNAAPREVFHSKLTGSMKKTEISNLFSGSGAFTNCDSNTFDALVVDEAHRLNEKSGMFKNYWENQIMEVIDASKFSIFFIDEDQKVTLHDIWETEEIRNRAKKIWVHIHELTLSSQFRCDWSDWYLARLDDVLQIRETANENLEKHEYNFQIVNSPNELRDIIFEKNKKNNKARLVAWYCRNWLKESKNRPDVYDININEYDFHMSWNLGNTTTRAIDPNSVNEIGCIHTCQWLEFDYVWVIVGDDLIVRNWNLITNPENRAKTDNSIKGWKKMLVENKKETLEKLDKIIKNTYRTLMTRWMKWCYVYFVDKETEDYFRSRM